MTAVEEQRPSLTWLFFGWSGRLSRAPFALAWGFWVMLLSAAFARIVIVPMVNTPQQARQIVEFGKFPPLGARGYILMPKADLLVGPARRTEGFYQLVAELIPLCEVMIERADIEVEALVSVDGKHPPGEEIIVVGPTVSGQPHHLPLVAREHVEAEKVGHRRIKLPERVRQLDAPQRADARARAA